MSHAFTSDCFRLRHNNPAGEEFWHNMMKTAQRITEREFLKACDVFSLLDEDETWKDYKQVGMTFFKADYSYFIAYAGFEFIFKTGLAIS